MGCFLTVQYSLVSEMTLARVRPWVVALPSWPVLTCLWCLVAYLIPDWRNMHLVVAMITVPFLATWWYVLNVLTLSPPKLKMSFGTTLTFSIILAFRKQRIELIENICQPMGMGLISRKIVQSQLRRRLLRAASKLGLYYFLWRLQSPMAIKGLKLHS